MMKRLVLSNKSNQYLLGHKQAAPVIFVMMGAASGKEQDAGLWAEVLFRALLRLQVQAAAQTV